MDAGNFSAVGVTGGLPEVRSSARIPILDGWRALSILLVIVGHFFPVGIKAWKLNSATTGLGMAIFFTLSGFLITQHLLSKPNVPNFLRRRLFRIIPLAWTLLIVVSVIERADAKTFAKNFLFVANLPSSSLMGPSGHLWSLCVEVQFYATVALIVATCGRRGLYFLPFLGLAITGLRITYGIHESMITWFRADEILAGASIALIYADGRLASFASRLPSGLTIALAGLAFAGAHQDGGWLCYFRPYFAACSVGISIYSAPRLMRSIFSSGLARYVADKSYALYIFHIPLAQTWLGSGVGIVKYLKRPILLAVTFAMSHLSTDYFEKRMIHLGRRLER